MKLVPLFFLLFLVSVSAYPKVTSPVTDLAGILTSDDINLLEYQISQITTNSSVEIAIVTVPNTEGDDRINYANRIGEISGVGKKGLDNGIVILWSQDNEKGGAIAVGRGIESILNDAKVARIGRNAREYFDSKDYYGGFSSILDEISLEIKGEYPQEQTSSEPDWIFIAVIIIIIFLIVMTKSQFGYFPLGGFGGGGSSGGGGFGGGSFGGGGGKF